MIAPLIYFVVDLISFKSIKLLTNYVTDLLPQKCCYYYCLNLRSQHYYLISNNRLDFDATVLLF